MRNIDENGKYWLHDYKSTHNGKIGNIWCSLINSFHLMYIYLELWLNQNTKMSVLLGMNYLGAFPFPFSRREWNSIIETEQRTVIEDPRMAWTAICLLRCSFCFCFAQNLQFRSLGPQLQCPLCSPYLGIYIRWKKEWYFIFCFKVFYTCHPYPNLYLTWERAHIIQVRETSSLNMQYELSWKSKPNQPKQMAHNCSSYKTTHPRSIVCDRH